jgi:putative FmdB family regulatory protein
MPKYEYTCGQCGAELEIEQRISEDALTTCPKCNQESLERLISRSNFALKGGGWYADGYGDGAGSGANGGSMGSDTKPDKSEDSTSSDSKPEKPEAGTADSSPSTKSDSEDS